MFVNDHTKCELNLSKSCCDCNIGPVSKTTVKRSCPMALLLKFKRYDFEQLWINTVFPLPNEHPVREHRLSPSVNQHIPLIQWASSLLWQGTSAISVCESTYSPYPMSIHFVGEHQQSPSDIQSAWLHTPQPQRVWFWLNKNHLLYWNWVLTQSFNTQSWQYLD